MGQEQEPPIALHSLTYRGHRVVWEETGLGDPIVWLQGLGADHSAWAVQIARFSARYRCIAPDLLDTGVSDRAHDQYSTRALAEDVLALLDQIGTPTVHVVGLSLGGSVAQHLALLAPERLRSLTLVSSIAAPDARLAEILHTWAALRQQLDPVLFYRQANLWLFAPEFFDDARRVAGVLRWVERHPAPQPAAAFARQVEASLAHDTQADLSAIRTPCLVIGGSDDILTLPSQQQALAAAIPGAQLRFIPHAAHSVNLEKQNIFNQMVSLFIDNPKATLPDTAHLFP